MKWHVCDDSPKATLQHCDLDEMALYKSQITIIIIVIIIIIVVIVVIVVIMMSM